MNLFEVSSKHFPVVVIGAGAAGFFASILAARGLGGGRVVLFEKTMQPLAKVRISGGGRCNVTHACFDPRELVQFYPRGSRELLGPFTRFQPLDTIQWFKELGVELKTEEDGRMFPITDRSETIIDALRKAGEQAGVVLQLGTSIQDIVSVQSRFHLRTSQGNYTADRLLLATGSHASGLAWAKSLGHTLIAPAPSLFTFNVPSSPLLDLAGLSVPRAKVSIDTIKRVEIGALLLTHWGFSGPAILRLSAWEARELQAMDYKAALVIDWTGGEDKKELLKRLLLLKRERASATFSFDGWTQLPKNLGKRLQAPLGDPPPRFSELSSQSIEKIVEILTASRYQIEGKTTYKQEFVTAGGVKLSEVDFRTMESRVCPGLYFAGEILDIDGITGGFNFQNAWTTGWIAGNAISKGLPL